MNSKQERKAIVVIGMHRSGTSTVSGIFNFLGFNLGARVIPALDDNPKGFFENIPLTLFNNRLLEQLGSSWQETYLIRKEWWKGDPLPELREELINIITQQFDNSDQLLFKDPRLSVLLPFYLDVFTSLEIVPYFIICIRNPSEVTASLRSRNHFPAEKSVLLWMDYMLNAELFTRAYPRSFILFNDLIQNPFQLIHEVARNFRCDIPITAGLENQIRSFVEMDLKHHNYSGMPSEHPFNSEIVELYRELPKAKDGKFTNQELQVIDGINTSFYTQMNLFQGIGAQIEASLVVVHGSGLKTGISAPVVLGVNRLDFDLSVFDNISEIRFIPANCRLGLVVQGIEIIDQNNIQIDVHEFSTGDKTFNFDFKAYSTRELLIFSDEIPELTLITERLPNRLTTIAFTVLYSAFGESALKLNVTGTKKLSNSLYHEREMLTKKIESTNQQLKGCREKQEKLEEEIQIQQQIILTKEKSILELYGSSTWKSGKLILGPVRFLSRIIQRLFGSENS